MPQNKKNQLKKIDRPFDFILFINVLILLAMGIVMVLSASSPSALSKTGNSYTYFTKQAIFAVGGIVAMLFLSRWDYHKYEKFANLAYIGSIILLALVPIFGSSAKGATRWLEIGPISFQPSEVAKVALIVFYASWLTKNKDNLKGFFKGFLKPFLYLIPIIIILVIFQDHLSATIIIVLIVAIMMLMAGSRLRYFLTIGSVGAVGGAGILWAMAKFTEKGAYRIARITTFLNPWSDATDTGWQIIQSLYAIGSGGLFGVGLRRK
jgi:cell division protein FtsW